MTDKLAQTKEVAGRCYKNYASLHDNITYAPVANRYDRPSQRYITWHNNHHSSLWRLRENNEILSVVQSALDATNVTLGKVLELFGSTKSEGEASNVDNDIQEFVSDSVETLQTCNDILNNVMPLSDGFKTRIHMTDRSARSRRVVEMFNLRKPTGDAQNALMQSKLGSRLARACDARGTFTESVSRDVGYEIVDLTPVQLQGLASGTQTRQILTKRSHALMNSTNPRCPFCFEIQALTRYDSHILQHLRPYVCTYDECTEQDSFFATRAQWLEHEAHSHRSTWLCPDCDLSSNSQFNKREDFERHLEATHCAHYEKRDILSAAKYARSGGMENRSFCPICGCKCDSRQLESHLADHLEILALTSLHEQKFGEEDQLEAVTGAENTSQRSDTDYIQRSSDFYIWGTVFRTLGQEQPASVDSRADSVISSGAQNQTPYSRPPWAADAERERWYVVISEGEASSYCLPINSYQGKGVRGLPSPLQKSDHSIVWVYPEHRSPTREEIASADGNVFSSMRDPSIQIVKTIQDSKIEIDPMARLYWKNICQIQHSVETAPFGMIHPNAAYVVENTFRTIHRDSQLNVKAPKNYGTLRIC